MFAKEISMYRLEKYTSTNNIKYLRIVEYAKGGKRNVIKSLGRLSLYDDGTPDFFERLKSDFESGKRDFDDTSSKVVKISIDKSNTEYNHLHRRNVGYKFLESYYESLGIDKYLANIRSRNNIYQDLDGITRFLVFSRILNPVSKKATFDEMKDSYFDNLIDHDFKLEHIYQSLTELNKVSFNIQKSMFNYSNKLINRKLDTVYYDLTNYHFEIKQNDDDEGLRRKGVAKSHSPNPIIQMGLFIDSYGLPICYKLFKGNTNDKTTFRPMIKEYIKEYNLGRVIVVADRINQTKPNMGETVLDGDGYVVSKSILKGDEDYHKYILDESDYTWLNDNHNFKYKSRIVEKEYTSKDGRHITYKEKQVFYWSKEHYDSSIKENKYFREYLESVTLHPEKLKDNSGHKLDYLKVRNINRKTGEEIKIKKEYELNYEKLEKQLSLLGFYCITTSETELSELEIIEIYHNLSKIEDSFRVIKTNLNGRPVFCSTTEHINAHFLICFISLYLIRLLQLKIKENIKIDNTLDWSSGMSAYKIANALKEFQIDKLSISHYKVDEIKGDIKIIFDSFNIKDELNIPTKSELNTFFRQIKTNNKYNSYQ
jgi:transposase